MRFKAVITVSPQTDNLQNIFYNVARVMSIINKIINNLFRLLLKMQNRISHNKKNRHQMVSIFLVRETGLEPVRVAPHAPQTCASADSATLASTVRSITEHTTNVNTFFRFFQIFFSFFKTGLICTWFRLLSLTDARQKEFQTT